MNLLAMFLDSLEGENKAERDFESTVGAKKSLGLEDQRDDVSTSVAAREEEGSKVEKYWLGGWIL